MVTDTVFQAPETANISDERETLVRESSARESGPQPMDLFAADRPSFRRRLLLTMGSTVAAVLVGIGVVGCLGLYGWMTLEAHAALDQEVRFVESRIVDEQGRLQPDAYHWDEPHHRFVGPHIDPFFVQVFDADQALVRQSDNIRLLDAGAYPDRVLQFEEGQSPPALHTIRVAGERLYYIARPLTRRGVDTIGFIQVARPYPNIDGLMRRAAWLILAGLALSMSIALGLVWWQSGRVLRPLATITSATAAISPDQLHERVPVPPDGDRETTQLAHALNALLDRLEKAFEEMYRFSANAAHELQTPLTVLRGHVEVALRRPRTPEVYQETLSVLGREIDELVRTVRSLLVLARLDRNARALPAEAVDLAALVRAEMPTYGAQARDRGLGLEFLAPPSALVLGQPDLLREVIANLLENAVKYTREGSINVVILDSVRQVVLEVRDTGIGMTADEVAKSTDRFFRAAAATRLDVMGSGLGLALVSQIIRRHRGDLRIDSSPGRGTHVSITLPAAP